MGNIPSGHGMSDQVQTKLILHIKYISTASISHALAAVLVQSCQLHKTAAFTNMV